MAVDVAAWLRGLGLNQYATAFADNDIDGDVLPELTAEDLAGIGVASIGHRRKLLAAIAALRDAPAATRAAATEAAASARLAPAESAAAERRQLTIMFCDVVGSTELATRLDPEDLREVIATYHGCVADAVARFGGFVAKYMGDGVLAYFGYPQAHEEDAERAVRCGLAIAAAVGRLALAQPLAVRIGIATGLVVVGDLVGAGAAQEQSVVGETPNLAARLQAVAGPDQVIVAEATRRQVGGLFELRDLGPQALKGFAATTQAWQVLGESGVASRFEALRSQATPLIGRDEEIDLLLRRWAQAKGGEGRVVLLSAEPGIGKSRLTEAVEERIAGEPHRRLRYFCSPHHRDSAFYPIVGQLERAAGFARDDDGAARLRKLAALLAPGNPHDADLPLLAELLSLADAAPRLAEQLAPQRKKEMIFEALLRALDGLARQSPVLMVFEDLHWIDPTSLELLDRVVARVERLPVLVLATFRPEYQPPWIGQAHVTMLALSRLARRDGAALVRRLAANAAALPDDIVDEIIERTDGVPLFLEEVTKVVIETEAAAARGAVAAIPGARAAVPATLQASLMARLDRLGPAAREIAQTGAAIGREFSWDLVTAVAARSEAETQAALDRLAAAGLVFQRGAPPTAEYQFKHALVQDTAYGSLLRGPRQALHARVAAAIERRLPDRVEREPEILAYHLTEAGQAERAATFWLEAGRRAAARSANIEAMAHLRRGIATAAALGETPERQRLELALQLAFGPAVMSAHGFAAAEATAAYRRARELAERLGDDRSLFAAVWGLWLAGGQAAMTEDREALLEELFRVAGPLDDPALNLQAHHSAWATRGFSGDLTRSQEHIREGLALYDRNKHGNHALLYGGHDPAVCGYGQSAIGLWALGFPDRALESAHKGIALGADLAHVPSVCHSLWFAGLLYLLRGDLAAAIETGERLAAIGIEQRLPQYRSIGDMIGSLARARQEPRTQTLDELRRSIASYKGLARLMSGVFLAGLAEAELRAGLSERAAASIEEAETAVRERGEFAWMPEVLRVRAMIGAGSAGDRAQVGEHYRQALEMAGEQNAKSHELRAALDLARLWAEAGRRGAARDLLAPIYAWFTEGFDTADLKAARALLDDLA